MFIINLQNSISPLHVASKWGRRNVVQLLLDNGATIDCKTRVRFLCLFYLTCHIFFFILISLLAVGIAFKYFILFLLDRWTGQSLARLLVNLRFGIWPGLCLTSFFGWAALNTRTTCIPVYYGCCCNSVLLGSKQVIVVSLYRMSYYLHVCMSSHVKSLRVVVFILMRNRTLNLDWLKAESWSMIEQCKMAEPWSMVSNGACLCKGAWFSNGAWPSLYVINCTRNSHCYAKWLETVSIRYYQYSFYYRVSLYSIFS